MRSRAWIDSLGRHLSRAVQKMSRTLGLLVVDYSVVWFCVVVFLLGRAHVE